jgi:hypothetical protein
MSLLPSVHIKYLSRAYALSGRALAFVPCGHGFDFYPDSQGVWRGVLLEPSGVGWWPILSHLWIFLSHCLLEFDLFNLIVVLRSPPFFGLGSLHLVYNTTWAVCTKKNHWSIIQYICLTYTFLWGLFHSKNLMDLKGAPSPPLCCLLLHTNNVALASHPADMLHPTAACLVTRNIIPLLLHKNILHTHRKCSFHLFLRYLDHNSIYVHGFCEKMSKKVIITWLR